MVDNSNMPKGRDVGLGSKYKRSPAELREHASIFWPSEMSEKEANVSVIPHLLKTQDNFLSMVGVDVSDINGLFKILETSTMPVNFFLKHLAVLSDTGGEMLSRIASDFSFLFPDGKLEYVYKGQIKAYRFEEMKDGLSIDNKKLGIDGAQLNKPRDMSGIYRDVIAILLFGSSSTNDETAKVLKKCEIGGLLGRPEELKKYVKERYIIVSRITGGAQANALGQFAQDYVKSTLSEYFSSVEGMKITKNGTIPGIIQFDTEEKTKNSSFDVLMEHNGRYAAIEVSFQVTTNSTIERKQGQAKARYEQIKEKGYTIAYVIDGAGNFNRKSALETICNYSDCTVAFSKEELMVLYEYMRDFFNV